LVQPNERGAEAGDGRLLLDSREVARLLGIGRSKVYMMLALGQLPTVRLGRCVRVPRPALERWLEAETSMPAIASASIAVLPARLRPRRP
jgi:excisionase family DNA binding protein